MMKMEVGKKRYVLLLLFSSFILGNTRSNPQPHHDKHFVLVHGACHGAWCWYKLATLLRSAGHRVTALDLAASGIEPKQANDLESVSDYFQPLREFMASLPAEERVILVGHSFGGLGISQAMENFPHKISVAVFVTAMMPGPTLNISTISQESARRSNSFMDSVYTYDEGPENPPTTFIFGPKYMSSNLYQLSPLEDWNLAIMLVRPIHLYSDEDMSKELAVSQEKYGRVTRVYIVCEEDKAITEDFQRWMIENNPTDEVKQIPGSDHMAMFSKPQELCVCLLEIAENCF